MITISHGLALIKDIGMKIKNFVLTLTSDFDIIAHPFFNKYSVMYKAYRKDKRKIRVWTRTFNRGLL